MTKAFDSVDRMLLMKDLQNITNPDELLILMILIEDDTLQIKNDNIYGDIFTTNVGVPQGDCLSPILFTLYLAKAIENNDIIENSCDNNQYAKSNTDSECLLPVHLIDHNYDRKANKILNINQQYADDIGYIGRPNTALKTKKN